MQKVRPEYELVLGRTATVWMFAQHSNCINFVGLGCPTRNVNSHDVSFLSGRFVEKFVCGYEKINDLYG
ncbi:hypothetical protein ACVI1I_006201 [Bradyrhizobium sp. USDA 4459]